MKPVHEEISELAFEAAKCREQARSPTSDDPFACPKEIRKKAMDFLARREYGQAELVKKLADKGYQRSIVEGELQRLTDEGLQSDTRFAESFVQSRINQGKGPVRIRADLVTGSSRGRSMKRPVTGMNWPARSAPRSSARACPGTSRKRPGRCVFFSTAVSSKTIFNRRFSRYHTHP